MEAFTDTLPIVCNGFNPWLNTGCPWKKETQVFWVHYSIIKNNFFKNVHIIRKLIFSSLIWHHNHDGRVTHDWAGTICTWYGTLTLVQGKWGSYAHVKNHNEPNVAAIHLFWTIGFLSVPLQIVCNRSCVIHWSCLWCHMKEENMSFPMMRKFKIKLGFPFFRDILYIEWWK